jgi:predicted transcriptional regulator
VTRGQELASEIFEKLPGESLGKSHYDLIAQTIDFAIGGERERCAKLLETLMAETPWRDQQWSRAALAIGARAIRRGRLLTDQEKLINLANSMEEDGLEPGSPLAGFVAELRRVAGQ